MNSVIENTDRLPNHPQGRSEHVRQAGHPSAGSLHNSSFLLCLPPQLCVQENLLQGLGDIFKVNQSADTALITAPFIVLTMKIRTSLRLAKFDDFDMNQCGRGGGKLGTWREGQP